MREYLVHVTMRPNDGSETFVVEQQFQAVSYPQAWTHLMSLGHKFAAKIISHKLKEIDEDGELSEAELEAPLSPAYSVLPAPKVPTEEPKTLTVNGNVIPERRLPWFGEWTPAIPAAIPFPQVEEHEYNDSYP